MGSTSKISAKEISIGMALPWAVCDESGLLLLQKGSIISSERQLQSLLERGLFRSDSESKSTSKQAIPVNDITSPFDMFHALLDKATGIFSTIILKKENAQQKVYKFCEEMMTVCNKFPDATVAAIHLCQETPYSICHSLHVALLSGTVAIRSGHDRKNTISLMAAAFTSNVSMLELQEILHHQQSPLTDEQRRQIDEHCNESLKMLREAGINDELWLKTVIQHHERPDGKGYPFGLANNEINTESQIMGIADRYAAMISPRSYRAPMTSKQTLREFFLAKNKEFNERLILSFIKDMGIFPPGTMVNLSNGETAVVIKKMRNKMWPMVSSIMGAKGEPYASPLRRDTNDESYSIKDTCTLGKFPHMSLNMIWGY